MPLTHDILRLAVINTLLTGMLSGSSCRYYVDFAPWWALCAAASWLYLRRLLDLSPHARGATLLPRIGLCCTLWSMICIFLYSAGLYRHLETSNPSLYQALARVTEGPLESLAAWWAPREGPQRLTVHLGNPAPGTRILLLESGTDDARDRLELEVLESSRMRLVFSHHGAPDVLSPSLPHAPGRHHEVSVAAGFLYPSETSPGWLLRGRKAMLEHTRRLLVQVDGQVVLDRYQRFHARPLLAADLTPATIGQGAQITALKGFDDVDRAWARSINPSPTFGLPPAGRHLYGTIRFGQGTPGQSEPLLVLGRSGAADVLLARWVDPTHVLLGLERWGSPCRLGAPLRIDARRSMRFEVNMTPIPTSNECSVEVHLDGQVVASFRSRLYPWEAEDCYLGENAVGSTIVLPRFGGQIAISSDDALAGQSP